MGVIVRMIVGMVMRVVSGVRMRVIVIVAVRHGIVVMMAALAVFDGKFAVFATVARH